MHKPQKIAAAFGNIWLSGANLIALKMHSFVLEGHVKNRGKWAVMIFAKDGRSYIDKEEQYGSESQALQQIDFLKRLVFNYANHSDEQHDFMDNARTWRVLFEDIAYFMAMPVVT